MLTLNIPETKQQDFFAELSRKHGTQFDDDLSFKAYLINRFTLQKDSQGKIIDAHALNFAAESGLENC